MSTGMLKAGFIILTSVGFVFVSQSPRMSTLPKKVVSQLKKKFVKKNFEPEKVNFC